MKKPHEADRCRTGVMLALCVCAGFWLAVAKAQVVGEGAAMVGRMAAGAPLRVTIGVAGAARDPAAVSPSKGPVCRGPVRAQKQIVISVGKSTLLPLPEPVRNRTLGNPHIVEAMLVSPQTLYLVGLDIGTTNMIVQGRSGSCSIIDVAVGVDPAGLQAVLAELMPEEKGIKVSAAADSLVLTGTVSDATKVARVVELANAFMRRPIDNLAQGAGPGTAAPGYAPPSGGAAIGSAMAIGAASQPASSGGANTRVVNMLQVAAPQQVMLEVKVAEVSKTLIDQLGASANLNGGFGSWSVGLLADFLSGSAGVISANKANRLPFNLSLDAQKSDGLVKILAEPNLMAISGQNASFLAGGKVFIPVPQSNGTGGTTIILKEEEFGVGLKFTPTVLENGRINLRVAPEVSELSSTGAVLSAPSITGTTILPLITTRRAATTLQVNDGQSFAIGGLIKNNVTGKLKALPGLGEIPVLGMLFRSTSFQQDKTELVFVVTPHLVKPLPPNYPLPTDGFVEPSAGQIYLQGNMEGGKPPGSPASNLQAPGLTPARQTPLVPSSPGPSDGSRP